jgi:hypothetical protein
MKRKNDSTVTGCLSPVLFNYNRVIERNDRGDSKNYILFF